MPLFVAITAVCGGLVARSTGHPADWAANLVGATCWALFAVLSLVVVRHDLAPRALMRSPRTLGWLAAWMAAGAVYVGAGTPVPSLSMAVVQLPNRLVMMLTAVGTGYGIHFISAYHRKQTALHELRAKLAEAQLRSLKLQLHPHFLYNALHSISALVRSDLAGARAMLAGLRELFAGALRHSDRPLVPLREEIQLVRTYLGIEQVRFGERLAVEVRVDPALNDVPVPPLLLQPLVENALRHGLAPRTQGGRLRVHARAVPGGVELGVEDDGVGLPQGWSPEAAGVGLGNLRDRLRHLYGDHARMTVEDASAGGTRVTVLLGAPEVRAPRQDRAPAAIRLDAPPASAEAPTLDAARTTDRWLPRVPLVWWGAFTGFWLVLIPFTAWLREMSWRFAGYPGAPGVAWLRAGYSSLYCFLLGCVCFVLAHRSAPGRTSTQRTVLAAAMSAAAGPAFGFGQYGLNLMLQWGLPPASGATRLLGPMTLWQNVLLNTPSCVALTWQFLAIGYALEFHRGLRAQAGSLAATHGELQQAELRLLRARLHPEFLFAAFDSIAERMRTDPGRADRLIALVGDFLRTSLRHSTRGSIPLRDEVSLLSLYLAVRQERIPHPVAFELAIAPEAAGVSVPHLSLSPLAEHLLGSGESPALQRSLHVAAKVADGRLEVTLRMVGGDEVHAESLPAALDGLRGRLQRTYGSRYALELGEEGRAIRLTMPVADAEMPSTV